LRRECMQVCDRSKKIEFPMVWGIHFPKPLQKAPRRARAPLSKKAQRSGFFDSLRGFGNLFPEPSVSQKNQHSRFFPLFHCL